MNEKKILNFMTIVVLAIICIHIAGIFIYKHERMEIKEKNPLYFALGVGFAGLGSGILLSLLRNHLLPNELHDELMMISLKK